MESVIVDISLEVVNGAFVIAFLTWVLLDVWRQRRDSGDINLEQRPTRGYRIFTTITVLSNVMVSISYLGFVLFEYWNHRNIARKYVFLAMTWFLATLLTIYAKKRTLGEDKRWPLVLTLWWVFSCVFDSVSLSIYAITLSRSMDLPIFMPEPNIVDFTSLPLALVLCFSAFPSSCTRKRSDIVEPLLRKENGSSSAGFTNAGIWSQVTFQWLNPIFKIGRIQKLELPHIPSVPQSETAEDASLLLEESLRKQKFEDSSLPKAIAYAIWKSLLTNAAFAGTTFLVILFYFPFHRFYMLFLLIFFGRSQHNCVLHGSSPDLKLCEFLVGE
jgi:hypothetical protein